MRSYWPYMLGFFLMVAAFLYIFRGQNSYEKTGKIHIEKTDDGFRLIKDGEPFHIKGASGSVAYLENLKNAGGNTIRFYDTINLKEKLDKAQEYGMAAIVDIPLPALSKHYDPYDTPIKKQRYKNIVRSFVAKYRNHPSLLMWILGNEIHFPSLSNAKGFAGYYNELVHVVKQTDPNHPVTTAIPQSGRHLILNLWYRTDLDLIAINTFGGVKELEKDLRQIRLLWDGPYIISEWNDEGPWSELVTTWGAPIEPTSSKKAERLVQVYDDHILPLNDRCLGSLAFYWGHKHERTHTWFSMFLENGEKTPSYFAMEQIFKNDSFSHYSGPELDFLMLNRYGPQESMILTGGQENTADVFFDAPECDSISISWEILPEIWDPSQFENNKEVKPPSLNYLILETNDNLVRFRTPEEEGPYRIFTYIKDQKGNVATANFPFYVINQANVQK